MSTIFGARDYHRKNVVQKWRFLNPSKAKASIYQMKHGFANEAERATEIRQGTFLRVSQISQFSTYEHIWSFSTYVIDIVVTTSSHFSKVKTVKVQKELRSESRHHAFALRKLKTSQRAKAGFQYFKTHFRLDGADRQ